MTTVPSHSHATAAPPTVSLLRLSAAQRFMGAATICAVLWLMIIAVLG